MAEGGSPEAEAPPHPPIPWQVVWFLDWGWFALLGTAVVFLPEAPALDARFALVSRPCPVRGPAVEAPQDTVML